MTHIEGLRHEESEHILKFLSDHVTKSADIQARYKWNEGDVCVWDQVRSLPDIECSTHRCLNPH